MKKESRKLKVLKTILLLLLTQVLIAQNYPHTLPYYDFIQYDSNVISYQGKKDALVPFYKKLDNIITNGEGKVNIMHFGGSHIQADIWSGELRKNFQNSIYNRF